MKSKTCFDPRTYLVIAVGSSILAVLMQKAYMIGVLTAAVFICTISFGVDLGRVFKKLKRLWQVIILVAILQSLFQPSGRVLLSFYDFTIISTGGLLKGIVVLCRLANLIMGGAMLAKCGSRSLIRAMIQMKIPYELAYMVSIAIRFLPVFSSELKDALISLQLRGVDIGRIKWNKRIKVYSYLMLPVVAGSIAKAQDLAIAMEMRGFRAYPKRTSYYILQMKPVDILIISLAMIFEAIMLYWWIIERFNF